MRSGNWCCVNLDKAPCDFNEFTSNLCPVNVIFNFTEGRKQENYFKITKPEERHGLDGAVDGMFFM